RLGHRTERAGNGPAARPTPVRREDARRQDGGVPGAEVLCGEVRTDRVSKVLVDIACARLVPAVPIRPGEELFAVTIQKLSQQPSEELVGHEKQVLLARLAVELELELTALNPQVIAPQRREAERAVAPCVLLAADAQRTPVEQTNGTRQDAFSRQSRAPEVAADPPPK